jgi:arsenical pump membrane protein
VLALVAAVCSPSAARGAASSTWPPFVLVAGLLAIGALAQAAGLFDRAASVLGRGGHSRTVLLARLLALVALVTVVLNLDTAAAFLTPIVILAARRRQMDERPFLYGTLLMTNAASLLLPGSNLTNLLVVAQTHQRALSFASHMVPAWFAAVVTTGAVTAAVPFLRGSARSAGGGSVIIDAVPPAKTSAPLVGVVIAVAALLVLVLGAPALPVGGLALVATLLLAARRDVPWRPVLDAVDPAVLIALFAIAVALGTVARSWDLPARAMAELSAPGTVVVAAVATVLCNNLPATVLLSGTHVAHPTALLLGLDLGPNLAVTGSLSALVWFKAATSVGARPDWRQVTRLGVVVVPVSMLAAMTALAVAAALR